MAFTVIGGGTNAFIPTTNDLATGALQVEFTRSVNTFPLTRYAQIVPVTKMTGYYLRQDASDPMRIVNETEFQWNLGQDRPAGKQNAFEFIEFTTKRFLFPFYIPQETATQAAWDTVAQHARSNAALAMLRRTKQASTVLATAANWDGNTAATATAIGGGVWSTSSEAGGYIQKSIQTVMQRVSQSSGGVVSPSQLMMVISPVVAQNIAQSPEVKAYVKNYSAALQFLQGSDTFSRWGIPPTLFGLGDVIVDDSVVTTSRKGATNVRSFVLGNGAFFVSRIGGLVGNEGATSFSTIQTFAFEDMTVEQFTDPKNRRIEGGVVDNSVSALVAPASGYSIIDTTT